MPDTTACGPGIPESVHEITIISADPEAAGHGKRDASCRERLGAACRRSIPTLHSQPGLCRSRCGPFAGRRRIGPLRRPRQPECPSGSSRSPARRPAAARDRPPPRSGSGEVDVRHGSRRYYSKPRGHRVGGGGLTHSFPGPPAFFPAATGSPPSGNGTRRWRAPTQRPGVDRPRSAGE